MVVSPDEGFRFRLWLLSTCQPAKSLSLLRSPFNVPNFFDGFVDQLPFWYEDGFTFDLFRVFYREPEDYARDLPSVVERSFPTPALYSAFLENGLGQS